MTDCIKPNDFKPNGIKPSDHLPFFGAKLIALKKSDGGLRSIAVGNTFRRLSAKCTGFHNFQSRQARCGNQQVGVGTKKALNWPHKEEEEEEEEEIN